MPLHLWETRTTAAIETTLRSFKRQLRDGYEAHVGELLGFADGDHASYMAGGVSPRGEDLTLTDSTGDPNCYFQRFLPNNWRNGQGGMVPQYVPWLPRLVQIKATLFHRHPTLSLVDVSGAVEEAATATFRRVLRKMRFTSRAKKLQKRTALLNTAFAYVRHDGKATQLDIITPDNVEVYPDPDDPANLDKALLIRHRLPSVKDSLEVFPERWLVWERVPSDVGPDQWFVFVTDNGWTVLDNPYFEDNVNPFGMFPYVVFNQEEQQDCIFQQLDDSLLAAQVGLDVTATWYHAQQPDGLHIFRTADGELPKEMATGRGVAIPLQNIDAHDWHQIPMQADAMKTYLEMTLKSLASMHGLDPDVFSLESEAFTQALTGLAAQMDRWDVQEVREDQEPYWEDKLNDLEDKIVTVHNHFATGADKIPEDLDLMVEWAQPEAPVDPQSQAQTRATNIERGIASAVDYIMEDHNLQSREKAMEKAREIASETAELTDIMEGEENTDG